MNSQEMLIALVLIYMDRIENIKEASNNVERMVYRVSLVIRIDWKHFHSPPTHPVLNV